MAENHLPDHVVMALLKREREALVGRLLPGLLHNVSGAMQMIRLPLDMVGLMLAQANHAQAGERLETVNQGLERLTHELEVLGAKCRQPAGAETGAIDLERMAREQLEFWRADLFFKHNVALTVDFPGGGTLGRGSWDDTCLAFNCLVANCVEALRDTEEPAITVRAWHQGDQVGVFISDSGPGPDEACCGRMFEPFVTTKGRGHDGLGLFLSRWAMQVHQGDVLWRSEPTGGFLLQLPAF